MRAACHAARMGLLSFFLRAIAQCDAECSCRLASPRAARTRTHQEGDLGGQNECLLGVRSLLRGLYPRRVPPAMGVADSSKVRAARGGAMVDVTAWRQVLVQRDASRSCAVMLTLPGCSAVVCLRVCRLAGGLGSTLLARRACGAFATLILRRLAPCSLPPPPSPRPPRSSRSHRPPPSSTAAVQTCAGTRAPGS